MMRLMITPENPLIILTEYMLIFRDILPYDCFMNIVPST